MKTKVTLAVLTTLLVLSGTLFASSSSKDVATEEKIEKKADKTLQRSLEALNNIMEDPENYIPPSLFIQSEGIVILPGAFKLAVGYAGGQGARGIALVRKTDGSWSDPFFVSLGEGSLGLQVGAQISDIFLFFRDKHDLLELYETELTLGGDIGVAAGPVSRGSSAVTDFEFKSQIYTYSHSNGLYAGVCVKGGVLTYNNRVNESLFCMEDISTDEFLYEIETPYYNHVIDLIDAINSYEE